VACPGRASIRKRIKTFAYRGELQMFFKGLTHPNGQIEKKDKNNKNVLCEEGWH
jgi:hypothetical protein